MFKPRHLLTITLLCASLLPGAQAAENDNLYSPDQLKSDFKALYEDLQAAHFNLYVNTPKPAYDKAYAAALKKLDEPMSLAEATLFFQRFVAKSRIAHARIDLPHQDYAAFREAGGKAFPLYIKVEEGKARITENYSGSGQLSPGDQLVSINGVPMSDLLAEFRDYLSADTPLMFNGFMEFRLPFLLWLKWGEMESFDIRLIDAGDQEKQLTLAAQTAEQVARNAKAQPETLSLDWQRHARVLPGDYAYLRPGPFFNTAEGADNVWDTQAFFEFIDGAFEKFLDADSKALLVDLRNNPGGDSSFSDRMVSWIADQPFRFTSGFFIKVSEQATAANQARLDARSGDEAGISAEYAEAYAGHEIGEVFEFEMPLVQPRQGRKFTRPVFALVNRHSYSNTVTVAALLQDYELATILGEETSDLATTYGAMEHFTLPETGIKVGFPKAFILRPNGDKTVRGVVPDIHIQTPLIEAASDPVLQKAIAIMKSRTE